MQVLSEHPRVVAATGPAHAWSGVHHLAEVTSTHDVALARLRDGDTPGFVVVGDRQTHGRGRAGRGWEDGPGPEASLMFTATTATSAAAGGELSLVPLATGLAVVEAAATLGLQLGLKWPNDVLAGERKCVGILVERHAIGGADVLLIGVGIDVDWRGVDRAGDRSAWTSLAEELDAPVDRGELLAEVLVALAGRVASVAADPAALLADYRRVCVTLGHDVQATGPGGAPIAGRAVDVDRVGRLLVDTADGGRVAVTAGDVTQVRPAAPDVGPA